MSKPKKRAPFYTRKLSKLLGWLRVAKYRLLSDPVLCEGVPKYVCPVLLKGEGSIRFAGSVHLGVRESPYFFSSYIYMDVRQPQSYIAIEDGVYINNNASLICDGPGIEIGKNTLIGTNFTAYNSDFHDLHPDRRLDGVPCTQKITIGNNVFIGSDVTLLKGASIGANSVIANGSVVTGTIPANVIAGGIPCKVIRPLGQV